MKQSSTRQDQARPGRSGRPTKGWPVLNRAGQDLTGLGVVSRTGQGRREGQYWTVQRAVRIGLGQDRANWVRIGSGRLGQERAEPGRTG